MEIAAGEEVALSAEPNIGLAIPSSFDNVQIHGVQKMSRCVVEEIAIAGRDNYAVEMQALELLLGQEFVAFVQPIEMRLPCRDGVIVVEAAEFFKNTPEFINGFIST